MKMKYKVIRPRLISYGGKYECTVLLKVGQIWRLFCTFNDSVIISRKNITIEIDKERFEMYFEKIEKESADNENK